MNNIQNLVDSFATQNIQVSSFDVVVNLLVASVLAYILGKVYVAYGRSLSNREIFSKNFLLMAVVTTLIITVVKSSLALSLGLVGALSIVRYRTAIKEPEELGYLFFTIAIGLGLGADLRFLTVLSFVVIVLIIILFHRGYGNKSKENLFFRISFSGEERLKIGEMVSILEEYCDRVDLKRLDDSPREMEASFLVEFSGIDRLEEMKEKIQSLRPGVSLTFLDDKGITF